MKEKHIENLIIIIVVVVIFFILGSMIYDTGYDTGHHVGGNDAQQSILKTVMKCGMKTAPNIQFSYQDLTSGDGESVTLDCDSGTFTYSGKRTFDHLTF